MTSMKCTFSSKLVYPLTIVLATFLYLLLLHRHTEMNFDGVTYLQGAGAYLQGGGISGVLQIGSQASWPFYSIFIAWVSMLLHVTPETAAYILNGFFIDATACLFIYLCCLLNKGAKTPWIAMVLWLTWPTFANAWPMIVRDFIFYFVFLLSMLCYYRYVCKSGRFYWAVLWFISVLVSFALRLEGIVFLVLVVFMGSMGSQGYCVKKMLKLALLFIAVLLIFFVALVFFSQGGAALSNSKLGLMAHMVTSYSSGMVRDFNLDVTTLRQTMFVKDPPVLVGLFLFLFRLASILFQALMILGPVAIYSLAQVLLVRKFFNEKLSSVRHQSSVLGKVLLVYMVLSLLIVGAFYLKRHFIAPRYLFPFALVAMVFVCSLTSDFFSCVNREGVRRWLLCLWLFIAVGVLISDFAEFPDRTMGKNVAYFLQENYPGAAVATNIGTAMYYISSPPSYSNGVTLPAHPKRARSYERILINTAQICATQVLVLKLPDQDFSLSLYENLKERGLVQGELQHLTVSSHADDKAIYAMQIDQTHCQQALA
jgi:hypothetical protein